MIRIRNVLQLAKIIGILTNKIDSSAECTDPNIAITILKQGIHRIVGKHLFRISTTYILEFNLIRIQNGK